jgi:hypothetical protein
VSWFGENSLYRVPITVDNSAGGAGAFDATHVISRQLDVFWQNVDVDGDQVRVTGPDGVTVVTKLDLQGFDRITKTCTLEIQDTAPAAGALLYWLYWGDDSLPSGKTAFVPTSPKNAHLDEGVPVPGYTVKAQAQQRLGETTAINQMAKTSDSAIHVWMDFGALLQRREYPSAGSMELECLSYVTVTAAAGLTSTASAIRFEGGRPGAAVVRTKLSGGQTGNDYLVTLTAVTTLGRTLTGKVEVQVRDIAT